MAMNARILYYELPLLFLVPSFEFFTTAGLLESPQHAFGTIFLELIKKWCSFDPNLEAIPEYFVKDKAKKVRESLLTEKQMACYLNLDRHTQNANKMHPA